MHVLITGGTGTIGQRLITQLFKHGHIVTVLSRQKYRPATLPAKIYFTQWDSKTAEGWGHLLEKVDAVVNLAGAGIADEKWTPERKQLIKQSRIDAGQAVTEAFRSVENKPKVLIQASAVGYYGPQKDALITENQGPGNDFLSEVCVAWEASSEAVEAMGVRRPIIRTGLVLDDSGGAFPKLIMPFRLGVGGPIGSGYQWYPWIHYLDEADAIRFLIEHETATGPFNLTAPNPLRNRDLAKIIGKVMHRPAFAPAPSFVFKMMFGEMSTVLLNGQRAVPQRLLDLGYIFKFPGAREALAHLLHPSEQDTPDSITFHSGAIA
jgi:uncharacterized protein (TIGR01777 family)